MRTRAALLSLGCAGPGAPATATFPAATAARGRRRHRFEQRHDLRGTARRGGLRALPPPAPRPAGPPVGHLLVDAPAWSPDGTGWRSARTAARRTGCGSSSRRQDLHQVPGVNGFRPAWSPDGSAVFSVEPGTSRSATPRPLHGEADGTSSPCSASGTTPTVDPRPDRLRRLREHWTSGDAAECEPLRRSRSCARARSHAGWRAAARIGPRGRTIAYLSRGGLGASESGRTARAGAANARGLRARLVADGRFIVFRRCCGSG